MNNSSRAAFRPLDSADDLVACRQQLPTIGSISADPPWMLGHYRLSVIVRTDLEVSLLSVWLMTLTRAKGSEWPAGDDMRVRSCVTYFAIGVFLVGMMTACKKKVALAPSPPPPVQQPAPLPPKVPTASLTAEPVIVEPGHAVTLKWSSTDATEAAISWLGPVEVEGTQEVRPAQSTTYELVATGPGGSARAVASVNVTVPPPVLPQPAVESESLAERVAELSDAYFDYDKSEIREDARTALFKDAEALRLILADFPDAVIVLEGHCDERGSAEYNLGLGDRRATSASSFIEALGVASERLQRISYGKERSRCTESTEECWQKNRRVHFAVGPTATN